MKVEKNYLDNGLGVITIPMEGIKSVTVLIMVGAGSRYETWEKNGIAHFAEHMFFKGTKRRPSSLAISSTIDSIGGEFNAFTSKEYTGYYIKASSSHLSLAIDVLSDMLLRSKFDSEEINKERGVILEEMRMYKDLPNRYVGTLYDSVLFGDHPLGWDTVGHEESIRNLSREDLLNYLDSLYSAKNMVFGVVGDATSSEAFEMANKFLGNVSKKETTKYKKYKSHQIKPSLMVSYRETEQAHLALGVRSYPIGHEKRYVVDVLNNILGGTMSSRLFTELREKRSLGYYVRSSVDEYLDAGTLVVQAGVRKEKIKESIEVVLNEFTKAAEQEVSEKELSKAKEYLKGKLILELEDSKEVAALHLSQEVLERKIRPIEELVSKIDLVTVDQVKSTANEIFTTESLNLALLGPYKKEENFLSLLKL